MFKRLSSSYLWLLLLLTIWIAKPLGATSGSTALEPAQVRTVMNQMLAYHVDEQKMTPELLKRALKLYVEQFDPERVYLLNGEADVFVNPSEQVVNEVFDEYNHDKFSYFDTLHNIIQQSIQRSRLWRAEDQKDPVHMVQASKDFPEEKDWDKRPFAANETELKARLLTHQLRFIDSQRKRSGDEALIAKEVQVLKFYERTRRSLENPYLFYEEGTGTLSEKDQLDQRLTFILKSLAKSLDAHTAFFSQREAYDMKVRLEKGFKGVGIVLEEGIDGVTINRIIEGGPAAKEGKLQAGDRIVAVDGVAVDDFTFDKILEMIRGDEGSAVLLDIKRGVGANESAFNVKLVRAPVITTDDRVDFSYIQQSDGIIGTMNLHAFYEGSYGVSAVRDVRDAIRELSKVGRVKGLVIDMRQNTGGFLMQAVKVAGLFISNGPIVTSKYSGGETRIFRDIDGFNYFEGPIVIVTSRLSASAAEIVAQALQDYGVALIVGDKSTYGKGSIQHQTVTDENSPWFFKVTVGRYYTPSGESTQIRGVQADIVVPGPLANEELGESFLEYPLKADSIPPTFVDALTDLDPNAQQWYMRHYLPSLQARQTIWRAMLPELRQNSELRLANNEKYTTYLKSGPVFDESAKPANKDDRDPQIEEAVAIVQDMVRLAPIYAPRQAITNEVVNPANAP